MFFIAVALQDSKLKEGGQHRARVAGYGGGIRLMYIAIHYCMNAAQVQQQYLDGQFNSTTELFSNGRNVRGDKLTCRSLQC